uniref:Lipoprotein n=1 Tax=Candidatus Kentrum sp. DK TaxID=2126562 RepID=A0A450SMT2_9GAMM|nr:MAG: hypothetical protein BECKDK2373C_GA0170839_104634 [Candidatus Kentron sp. DK]
MKNLFVTLLGLLLIACSTTIPKATKTSGFDTMNAIVGSGIDMGIAPVDEPPDRRYQGISATALYDFIRLNLTENHFKIEWSDRSIGEIRGTFEKNVVRGLGHWKQKYYAHFELESELEDENTTVMYYYFWVKEKSPLGKYEKVESEDKYAEQVRDVLLSRIDQYVLENGGRF